jgi:hypothetical protein
MLTIINNNITKPLKENSKGTEKDGSTWSSKARTSWQRCAVKERMRRVTRQKQNMCVLQMQTIDNRNT